MDEENFNVYDRSSSEDGLGEEKLPMIGSKNADLKYSRSSSRHSTGVLAALVVSLVVNAIFLGFSLSRSSDLDAICIQHTSAVWSPIMDDVALKYEEVTYDGSFPTKSVHVQDPSPEVDQAWAELGTNFRTILVPEERGAEAGIDPSAVKIEAAQGGGYLANVQVLHNIHCLNLIRQTLPWNVEYYRSNRTGVWESDDTAVRSHVDHCLDTLRQQVQCHGDVGMFGEYWIKRKGRELNVFPIFGTVHMCRNFNDILEWAKDHQTFEGAIPELRDDDVIIDAVP